MHETLSSILKQCGANKLDKISAKLFLKPENYASNIILNQIILLIKAFYILAK